MRYFKIAVIIVFALAVFRLGAYYQQRKPADELANPTGSKKQEASVGVTVRASKPETRDMYETVRATGTLEPIYKVDVYSKVPGDILEVLVEEGAHVEKGQTLTNIDDKELSLNVQQADVNYKQAQTNLKNIKATYERSKSLYKDELISAQQYEQIEAQYRLALGQVKSAKVMLQQAGLSHSYARIAAPMSGVVTFRDCENNKRISQANRIFEVSNLDVLRIKIRITENEIPAVRAAERPVKLEIEALKNSEAPKEYEGKITLISPVVDSSSGTSEVRVEVQNTDGSLTSGMFTRVVIETKLHEQTNVIPKQALLGEEGAYYVFIVKKDANNKLKAHRVDITTGLADDNFIEITGGEITDTDDVVIEGQNLLNEGDAVVLASAETGAATGEAAPGEFSPESGK